MKKLKKDLQTVTKEFDALITKTKQLVDKMRKSAADDLEKAQALVKPEVVARRTVDALKTLTKTMEKITAAVDKFEKKAATKRKAKAKAKPAKKARAKKAAPKKPAAKKAKTVTATDQVLKIIKRSKKGVGVPTLIKKTGFDDSKVRNIINRTLKQGKIKRVGRGIYGAT
jgi:septal ring factor EnvC (AmiA/AmiB activator)